MSRRVELAKGANAVFLIIATVMGVLTLALGVGVIASVGRITEAQPDASPIGLYGTGGVLAAVGLLLARWGLKSAGAVAAIEIGGDGTWTLISRFGRTLATLPPGGARRLALGGYRVLVPNPALMRLQPVVRGRLHAGDRSFRVAESGPQSYDRALQALGFTGSAPRPGEKREYA